MLNKTQRQRLAVTDSAHWSTNALPLHGWLRGGEEKRGTTQCCHCTVDLLVVIGSLTD